MARPQVFQTFTYATHFLPDLPYDYGALEPHISAEIMELHYSKHHSTYVKNLNIAEEKLAKAYDEGFCVYIYIYCEFYVVFLKVITLCFYFYSCDQSYVFF